MPLPLNVGSFTHGLLGFTWGGIVRQRSFYTRPEVPRPYKPRPVGSGFLQLDDPDSVDLNGVRTVSGAAQMLGINIAYPPDPSFTLIGLDGAWVQRDITINPGQRLHYRYAFLSCDAVEANFALFEIVANNGDGDRLLLQDGFTLQQQGSPASFQNPPWPDRPWVSACWPPEDQPALSQPFVGSARWLVCNGAMIETKDRDRLLRSGNFPLSWRAFPSTLLLDTAVVL